MHYSRRFGTDHDINLVNYKKIKQEIQEKVTFVKQMPSMRISKSNFNTPMTATPTKRADTSLSSRTTTI